MRNEGGSICYDTNWLIDWIDLIYQVSFRRCEWMHTWLERWMENSSLLLMQRNGGIKNQKFSFFLEMAFDLSSLYAFSLLYYFYFSSLFPFPFILVAILDSDAKLWLIIYHDVDVFNYPFPQYLALAYFRIFSSHPISHSGRREATFPLPHSPH